MDKEDFLFGVMLSNILFISFSPLLTLVMEEKEFINMIGTTLTNNIIISIVSIITFFATKKIIKKFK